MKSSFTLVLISILFAYNSNAQTWAMPSSRWQYKWYSFGGSGSFDMKVEKDTTVEGVSAKKIIGYDSILFTYLSGDTAYVYWQNKFRPTYYFGSHVGDTLAFFSNPCAGADSAAYGILDSIGSLNFGGQALRTFSVHTIYPNNAVFSTHFKYAERLGMFYSDNGLNFFYPIFHCTLNEMQEPMFCNYGDSSVVNFWLYTGKLCLTDGLNLIPEDIAILNCIPNPSYGSFILDLSGFGRKEKQICIYDQVGQNVYNRYVEDALITLDVNLKQGVYYVEIAADKKKGYSKLVIE